MLSLLAALLALAAAPGPAAADPGAWDDSQTIAPAGGLPYHGAANASGAFTVFRTPQDDLAVSHRGPTPGSTWSQPRHLERSGTGGGPFVVRPGDAGAVFFTSNRVTGRSYSWDISAEGVPSTRQSVVPADRRLVVTSAAARKRTLIAAGTPSGIPGQVRAAHRQGTGRWQLSQPFPVPYVDVVGTFFDRTGMPHVVVVEGTPDTRPGAASPAARRGRSIYEARLHRDGSWTSPRLLGTAPAYDQPSIAANDDGDLALQTVEFAGGVALTQVLVRPYGGDWSDPVRFPERFSTMAMDAAGRTVVTRGGDEITLTRISPLGAVTSQQLTDQTFSTGNPDPGELTVARSGAAVVALLGERADPGGSASVLRTFRCVAGAECVQVGDFPVDDNIFLRLASGPSGTAYLIAGDSPPCEGRGVCSWRLPAP